MPASAAVSLALTTQSKSSELPSPEQIVLRAGLDTPSFIAPKAATLFAERALRLRQLAAGHALRDYLLLMALVCEALHERAQASPAVTPLGADALAGALESGQPPLAPHALARAASWRTEWRTALAQVLQRLPADSPARATVEAVIALPDAALEQQADRLLAGITLGLDMAAAPLIAAGLQLYWTQWLAATAAAHPDAFKALAPPASPAQHCPCCGSLPTASITRSGQGFKGQRFLHCALCNAQWRAPMVCCSHCGSAQGIQYQALQAAGDAQAPSTPAAVEAETCEACRHYLKIVHMERDAHVEPMADDLATLTLDLLVSDAGYQRHGTNLLLLFGDSEPPQPEPA